MYSSLRRTGARCVASPPSAPRVAPSARRATSTGPRASLGARLFPHEGRKVTLGVCRSDRRARRCPVCSHSVFGACLPSFLRGSPPFPEGASPQGAPPLSRTGRRRRWRRAAAPSSTSSAAASPFPPANGAECFLLCPPIHSVHRRSTQGCLVNPVLQLTRYVSDQSRNIRPPGRHTAIIS